jgi:uncharacterized protein YqeY
MREGEFYNASANWTAQGGGMGLQDKLNQELMNAMRAKDQVTKDTLRLVKTAIRNAEVEQRQDLTDDEILQVIGKQAKMLRDALEEIRPAGRVALAEEYEAQLRVLEGYLPEMMSREEIEAVVREVVVELGAEDLKAMGGVMREMMSRLKGRADGKLVNQVVREQLAGD